MKALNLFFLLIIWLFSGCQSNTSIQLAIVTKPFNTQPLDSITKKFLVHAHDSAETYSDTLVSKLTQALQVQGVDTILYFRTGCSGCDILVEKGKTECYCNTAEQSSYLLWQYQGRTFSKKLDCCRNHAVTAGPAEAFAFYVRNQKALTEEKRFYAAFKAYNEAHPNKPKFLPRGPIHDLDVSEIHWWIADSKDNVAVWGGTYDSVGNPLFMKYEWRRKEWEWAKLLNSLTSKPYTYRP